MGAVTIQKGDTLSKLVAKYNRDNGSKLSVADVAKANGLKNANLIIAGKSLQFPDSFETAPTTDKTKPVLKPTLTNEAKLEKMATKQNQVTVNPKLEAMATKQNTQVETQKPGVENKPVVETKKFETQKPVTENKPVVQQTQTQQTEYPRIPKDLMNKPGALNGDGQYIIEEGIKRGGYQLGLRWAQELAGVKIDGKFGKGTYDGLNNNASVIGMLRDARIKETPNGPLAKMSAKQVEDLKAKLYEAYSSADFGGNRDASYEKAVEVMQEQMVRQGEPMVIDGKLGKETYKSMVRMYGKQTADDLAAYMQSLKEGVD